MHARQDCLLKASVCIKTKFSQSSKLQEFLKDISSYRLTISQILTERREIVFRQSLFAGGSGLYSDKTCLFEGR